MFSSSIASSRHFARKFAAFSVIFNEMFFFLHSPKLHRRQNNTAGPVYNTNANETAAMVMDVMNIGTGCVQTKVNYDLTSNDLLKCSAIPNESVWLLLHKIGC